MVYEVVCLGVCLVCADVRAVWLRYDQLDHTVFFWISLDTFFRYTIYMTESRLLTFTDKITSWVGTPISIVAHTVVFIGIFGLQFVGISFDQILLILTTAVSLEAIYLAIFIQMSVNRTSQSLAKVEEHVENVKEDVEDIAEDVEDIQEDVEDVKEDVGQLEENVDEIQEDVEDIQEDAQEDDMTDKHVTNTLATIAQQLAVIQKELSQIQKKN